MRESFCCREKRTVAVRESRADLFNAMRAEIDDAVAAREEGRRKAAQAIARRRLGLVEPAEG
jgi:hypothetical protein